MAGEPLLAPDDATAGIQLIDVKDMAAFAIGAIENRHGGTYNVVGPVEPLPLPVYLNAWGDVTGNGPRIVWVDPAFLLERGVRPFEDIPNWIPANDPEPGFYRISGARARLHGLSYRPLQETIRDEMASLRGQSTVRPSTGLSRARELQLIEEWRAYALKRP